MKATKAIAAVSALLFFAAAAAAQTAQPSNPNPPRTGSIRGNVLLPNGRPVTEPMRVALRQLRGERSVQYTDSRGSFHMGGLPPGVYTVEIEADRDRKYEPGSERVEVFPDTPSIITVYLKEKSGAAEEKSGAEAVSAAELDGNVPAAALKEFERGTKAGREGKFEEAAGYMRKALSIHPDYLKARNDLGTFLLAQGKLEEAEEELAAAIKLAPRAFNPRLNLGIVLVRRHQFAGAAENLEVALALDPNSPSARLYSGLARMGLGESARAEKELATAYELGGGAYALAQYHLGQLYMDRGERQLARKAFETYLRDKPDAANAEEVRRLLGMLR
jgi:Tfp pilus assembly protein PilF